MTTMANARLVQKLAAAILAADEYLEHGDNLRRNALDLVIRDPEVVQWVKMVKEEK